MNLLGCPGVVELLVSFTTTSTTTITTTNATVPQARRVAGDLRGAGVDELD